VSRGKPQRLTPLKFRIGSLPWFCKFLLTSPTKCGIINTVKRERRRAARVMVNLRGCQNHKRKIKCRKPLDKPHKVWYNVSVVRKRTEEVKSKQKIKKKMKMPLDKSLNLCYNKDVLKRGNSEQSSRALSY
jgi:hypothetical protein